jgi:hypothetical protein
MFVYDTPDVQNVFRKFGEDSWDWVKQKLERLFQKQKGPINWAFV